MGIRHYRLAGFGLALGSIGLVAACSEPGAPVSPSPVGGGPTAVTRTAEIGSFEICKDYVGTPGPTVTFNIAVDTGGNGTIDSNIVVNLSNGQCQEFFPAVIPTVYNVVEQVPAGYTASWVRTTRTQAVTTTEPSVSGNTAVGTASGDRGQLIAFTNTQVQQPPGGGEGCTPGYWKQDQHFDSWTAPFTPSTLFSAVFENAFPGMTLLQVLEQGGGGLDALGRHTVAALLNAASPNVDFDLTTAQVISMFNATFPGTKAAYETRTDQFAALNELGCPLN